MEKVHKRVEILPIEEISAMVQNFYQALSKRLETHDNFAGLDEDERTKICDLTERWDVFTQIHDLESNKLFVFLKQLR